MSDQTMQGATMCGLRHAHCSAAPVAVASQSWCAARGCRLPQQGAVTRADSCARALQMRPLVPAFQADSMSKGGCSICLLGCVNPLYLLLVFTAPAPAAAASKGETEKHQAHRQFPSRCWPPAGWWCTFSPWAAWLQAEASTCSVQSFMAAPAMAFTACGLHLLQDIPHSWGCEAPRFRTNRFASAETQPVCKLQILPGYGAALA